MPKNIALYIHVPYCLEKCPYCDFHSVATSGAPIPEIDYADVLIRQLKWEVERLEIKGSALASVFFGGGTPSLMKPEFFGKVLSAVSEQFDFDSSIEITVETNPASALLKNFQAWRAFGINRISFGVQSFQEHLLKKLGRRHTPQEAREAIQSAREAGFDNISCDFIFGIEEETLEDLEKDLKEALSFDLPHISAYQLTVESGTPLAVWVKEGTFHLPDEDHLVMMHKKTVELLENGGLKRYEISNYSKIGLESRHNLQYWRYGDCLGIGSGAVSCVNGKRWRTTRKLKNYLSGNWDYEDEETISDKTALKEKWMMGLRLAEGVELDPVLHQKWGSTLSKWEKDGLLQLKEGRVVLTEEGFLMSNWVTQNIFEMIEKVC
ncbi:MAG: radical SAM family heme chaperone HemW [Deltaproteobacteria bacterium]|nr:radical SAM family heme chaperone HemW [Deltaproteobacteria bacterium]